RSRAGVAATAAARSSISDARVWFRSDAPTESSPRLTQVPTAMTASFGFVNGETGRRLRHRRGCRGVNCAEACRGLESAGDVSDCEPTADRLVVKGIPPTSDRYAEGLWGPTAAACSGVG